ncbi:hypothetical protein HHI36_012170 [Cryptolaemus montrouzieri]|uniref:N-acetyllactosaminide beta-1,3-N-acetylglucosaminyltransferase n=1 Tax=Cryptolaemus montrouzieri TaxID=559131 RepID=A0ABD2NEM4_9CUCU
MCGHCISSWTNNVWRKFCEYESKTIRGGPFKKRHDILGIPAGNEELVPDKPDTRTRKARYSQMNQMCGHCISSWTNNVWRKFCEYESKTIRGGPFKKRHDILGIPAGNEELVPDKPDTRTRKVPKHNNVFSGYFNCSVQPPYFNVSSEQMYKAQKNLLYPVNVGRNIARETAQTHFILPSDIELYPSANVIPKFLSMIADNKAPLLSKNPKVFPLHIFEVSASSQVPENKTTLLEMLHNGTAIPFHKKVCPECHAVPKSKEWQQQKETKGGKLHVFHVGKRNGRFVHWEPIFIGTHSDPLYDERLSWEGKSDKMTQGYALCVMDYSFLILDNAFLVHKPGIKVYRKDAKRDMLAGKTRRLIKKIIFPELKILYGSRKGCAV